jgi:C4-dicarboxylate-specific signal transduction histidine kinase
VPVLVGTAKFRNRRTTASSFVHDLTERERGEREARESERRYSEVQIELAHANRVATLGQLTTSIAHEVNQPLGTVVTNTQAASTLSRQRWSCDQRVCAVRSQIDFKSRSS